MSPAYESWKRLLSAAELLSAKMPSTKNLAQFHARDEVIQLREAINAVKVSTARVPESHEFDENGDCLWCPAHRASAGEIPSHG